MDEFENTKYGAQDPSKIKGWGIDADPDNDPTYPMRDRSRDDKAGYSWGKAVQQPIETEVLHSNERPNLTAVFGAANPPSGLSGMLRRIAFRYGESSYGHWLPLLLADRINVFEGILDDLLHLRVPNVFAEKGMKAQWKYNRKAVVKQAAVAGVLLAGTAFLIKRRKARKRSLSR